MRQTVLLLLFLLGFGCSSPTRVPIPKLVPGLITGFNNDDPHVTLEVIGTTLSVAVDTYGNSCRSIGDLETSIDSESRHVQLAPFDWEGGARICSDILLTFEHTATIELTSTGTWSVTVSGQDGTREPVQFEYAVQAGG